MKLCVSQKLGFYLRLAVARKSIPQKQQRACAEPVKMSFCIQDSAQSVHTN